MKWKADGRNNLCLNTIAKHGFEALMQSCDGGPLEDRLQFKKILKSGELSKL